MGSGADRAKLRKLYGDLTEELFQDLMVYGNYFVDSNGNRVDPKDVYSEHYWKPPQERS